jgi:hypothetical protein
VYNNIADIIHHKDFSYKEYKKKIPTPKNIKNDNKIIISIIIFDAIYIILLFTQNYIMFNDIVK